MKLPCFTEDAYNELLNYRDDNESKYYSEEPWIEEFFRSVNLGNQCQYSSIVVPNVKLESGAETNEEKCFEDLLNVKQLYGAYKDRLAPAQAANPRLWTALCHTTFSEYVRQRWSDRNGKVNIKEHFFATNGRASLCYYNAISRLWWAGYLSYDESRESTNPWHLTETLLSAQQILKDFADQGFSASKPVQMGLLSALKRIQEETGDKATRAFRLCCDSYLNHYAAVTVIDALEPEEIEDIAYSYMKKHL